jgi:hypothetical protein
MGEMIIFSICNKPFKPLGIPREQVKSHEGLPAMIPINNFFFFFGTMLLSHMNCNIPLFLFFSLINKIKCYIEIISTTEKIEIINTK